MLNKSLIKIILITSFITGALLGIIPLIPFLIWIGFLLVMFFISPFIIIYLKHLNLINEINIEQSLIIGGISGVSAFLGYSALYFPIAFILRIIFKIDSYLWIKVLFNNIGFLLAIIILTALLCGLLNMFSAFLTAYIYEYFSKKQR